MLAPGRCAPRCSLRSMFLLPALLAGSILHAADADLSTSMAAPGEIQIGLLIPVILEYANAGPDPAGSAYVQVHIPSGVPDLLDRLTQEQRDRIQASADDTDTLDNAPILYDDERYCEGLILQLQRGVEDDGPVGALDPGVSGSFRFELPLPQQAPTFGRFTITEPPSLAQMWRPAETYLDALEAGERHFYSRGICENLVSGPEESTCAQIEDNCWGPRLSLTDPIEAELEVVNDGSAFPTHGCRALIGFTPGSIAVVRRGSCEFGQKAFEARRAGAVAAIVINDGRCPGAPGSDHCVFDMIDWIVPTIPTVMLSQSNGEPIIAALESGTTVRGVIGSQIDDVVIVANVFLADDADHDPDPANDVFQVAVGVGEGSVRRPSGRRIRPSVP